MKEFILNEIRSKLDCVTKFDPAELNDTVALQTSWLPMHPKTSSEFLNHELVKVSNHRFELKGTGSALGRITLFLIAGLGFTGLSFFTYFNVGEKGMAFVSLFVGLILLLVAYFQFNSWKTSHVFDRKKGFYWKGKEFPGINNIDHGCRLEDIYAIQLMRRTRRSSNHSSAQQFDGYSAGKSKVIISCQLIIVLNNGERLLVLYYGTYKKLKEYAGKLSSFLDVPLWDGYKLLEGKMAQEAYDRVLGFYS